MQKILRISVVVLGALVLVGCSPSFTHDNILPTTPSIEQDKTLPATADNITPYISSIAPSYGPKGTVVEIKGSVLSGFESDVYFFFERSDGKVVRLSGVVPLHAVEGTQTASVVLKEPCQKGEIVGGDYSGIPNPCYYVQLTPGIYKVYTRPWGTKSNEVEFTITPQDESTGWKTYHQKNYGFSLQLPPGWVFGAITHGDKGGAGLFENIPSKWTVEPAPTLEARPQDLPVLEWIFKDDRGVPVMTFNLVSKNKWRAASLEQFASEYPTPKDKITNIQSEKLKWNDVFGIKQTHSISDPDLQSGPWYYFASKTDFFVFIVKQGVDLTTIEQIFSTLNIE